MVSRTLFVALLVFLPAIVLSKQEAKSKDQLSPQKVNVESYYPSYPVNYHDWFDKGHIIAEAPLAHHAPVIPWHHPSFKRFEPQVEELMNTLRALLDKMTFAIDKLLDDTRVHYY